MPGADRRVRRTRRLLQEALVELVADRGYERVTVQDVLDRADIGRSTFYAHFRDKEALFSSCFDDLREDLRRHLDAMSPGRPPEHPTRPVGSVFEHAYRNRAVYRAVCGRRGENMLGRQLHPLLVGLLPEHLPGVGTRLRGGVAAESPATALLGGVVWGVRQVSPWGRDGMAQMCMELPAPGVRAGLTEAHRR